MENSNENGALDRRYSQEEAQWNKYIKDGVVSEHAESWLHTDTVDYYRHHRMYACIDPLLKGDSDATWLTVGDGRFGRDAHYIQAAGRNVTASDISESLLAIGKERGYINNYKVENLEQLSFPEDSFDYVFAKECLHHLPRP